MWVEREEAHRQSTWSERPGCKEAMLVKPRSSKKSQIRFMTCSRAQVSWAKWLVGAYHEKRWRATSSICCLPLATAACSERPESVPSLYYVYGR